MSMNARYRAISPRLAARVREVPALVRAVIDADAGDPKHPGLPPQLRALLDALPPEMTERLGNLPELHAQMQAHLATAAAIHRKAADAATKALSDEGYSVSDVRDVLDIEKAWHGLHYLLTGTTWEPTEPPGNAVLGGTPIGGDLGYGPARLMTSDEVARTAIALNGLTEETLEARFDAEAMSKAGLYGGHWAEVSPIEPATYAAGGFVLGKVKEREWLLEAFARLKTYFASASERGDAMLLYVV